MCEFSINFPKDDNNKTTNSSNSYLAPWSVDMEKGLVVWGQNDPKIIQALQNKPDVSTFGDKIVCEPDALCVRSIEDIAPEDLNPKAGITAEKMLDKLAGMKRPFNNTFNGQSKFTPDIPMNIDEDLFNQAIKNYVENYQKKHPDKKSVLADKGSDFLKAANEYSMVQEKTKRKFVDPDKKPANPFLLAGIAMHESACGTSEKATDGRNNIGGFAKMKFKSVEDSIYYLGGLIDLNRKQGKETVAKLACSGAYCAKSVANGKTGWISMVSKHANDICAEYNRLFKEKYYNN